MKELYQLPKRKGIFPLEEDLDWVWEEHTYYIVEASFASSNPIRRYIFYSGFLHEGRPSNYNSFLLRSDEELLKINNVYYMNVLESIAHEKLHEGATVGARPLNEEY